MEIIRITTIWIFGTRRYTKSVFLYFFTEFQAKTDKIKISLTNYAQSSSINLFFIKYFK